MVLGYGWIDNSHVRVCQKRIGLFAASFTRLMQLQSLGSLAANSTVGGGRCRGLPLHTRYIPPLPPSCPILFFLEYTPTFNPPKNKTTVLYFNDFFRNADFILTFFFFLLLHHPFLPFRHHQSLKSDDASTSL